ncbi:hypothetical protein ACIA4K_04010 [Lactobacillus delbrueckii subsp. bulgaricus]|uniref:hypothetical protein n=1 Tax=Lactobacillus delbrueckii TaxID=1584 RepID=UPI00385308CB
MRVNFILPGLGDSGGIQVVKKYAELFREKGIDVVIYSSVIADDLHRYQKEKYDWVLSVDQDSVLNKNLVK